MIVEFIGNSGAGKSSLIPILVQSLRGDGLTAMSVTEAIYYYMRKTCVGRLVCFVVPRAWQGPVLWRIFSYFISKFYIARFVVENSRLANYVVKLQFRRQIPWQHRWLILRLFFKMAGCYQFFKCFSQPSDVLIFDEGFVHRAVHMFVSESEHPNPDRIAEYLKLLPRPGLVVKVQASLNNCLARIYARGLQVRLRTLKTQDVARFLANAEQVVNIVSLYLKSDGWQVIKVENVGDLAVSAAELHHNAKQYLSSTPSAIETIW